MIQNRIKYYENMVDAEDLPFLVQIASIPDFLDYIRKTYTHCLAISDGLIDFTYNEFVSRIARRVHLIRSLELRHLANIIVYSNNTVDAMELFLAIPAAGCVVMMLPSTTPIDAMPAIVKKFDIDVVFASESYIEKLDQLDVKVVNANQLGYVEDTWIPTSKDTPAAIFMTGGTTDNPKGVVLSHGAIMSGAYNGCFCPGKVIHQRYMAILPLSHVFGALRGFLTCLYTGSSILACPDIKEAISNIPSWKPTVLVLVPGMIEIIMNLARLKGKAFLGDLKLVVSGAAPLSPSLIEICNEFDVKICHGYGLTEAANLTSGNNCMNQMPDAVGPLYPNQEAKIVNGELWLKGDNIMLGYYNEPKLNSEVFEDGWLKTGDLAKFEMFDGVPFLVITGRIKNLIILPNGENVSPEEIEEKFYKYNSVKECLVQEMRINETPVLGIEVFPDLPGKSKEDIKKILESVVSTINDKLPSYSKISKLVIRKEPFEKSRAMKILRNIRS